MVAQLVSSLRSLWEPHHKKGLQVRHETGKLLNARLGNPGDRQEYGAGTCEKVADQMKMCVSELSRMRAFAFRYPDLDDFQTQNPKYNTWTKLKAHLGTSTKTTSKSSNSDAKRLCRSLKSAIKNVLPDNSITEKDKDQLVKLLRELCEATTKGYDLGIRIEWHEMESGKN
jgi:hypothetical protein